jgi:hypothetical protein
MKTIYLVGCGAKKAPRVAQAKDLYLGDLFQKSRAYVESLGASWLILSAKWGTLHPDASIRPYDESLNNKSREARFSWAVLVMLRLRLIISPGDRVVILAGEKYREFLIPELQELGAKVEVPLKGLGIGKQLAWLKNGGRKP